MSHEGHKGCRREGHEDQEGVRVFFFVSFVASLFEFFVADRGGATV